MCNCDGKKTDVFHNSDFITRNCEFKSCNSEKKVRIVRCKLTIVRKKVRILSQKATITFFIFIFSGSNKLPKIFYWKNTEIYSKIQRDRQIDRFMTYSPKTTIIILHLNLYCFSCVFLLGKEGKIH